MHGLIFVTWERYLSERFGETFLKDYREAIGETPATSPLASRTYSDDVLIAGVETVCKLTGTPLDTLLWEYGRYFMFNGLTSHLCAYLLTKVSNGRDLLLMMRQAHAQMRRLPDGLTPPLFEYETLSTSENELSLVYDSPRRLCALLWGAIEGAAQRYGQRVQVVEVSCMKRGAPICRFDLRFTPPASSPLEALETPEQIARRANQQQMANLVLSVLPTESGLTLAELQERLRSWEVGLRQLRPAVLLEALRHLQHAGLVSSTANQPGDNLANRRYWRAPTE
ncbi:MAG TPA: heme NO-binding domain-containing protein [Ktedonobacteraceae bacterium]|nr:heme NO-binding domain-containing protein [Ktedonobacteraceae bacterium]